MKAICTRWQKIAEQAGKPFQIPAPRFVLNRDWHIFEPLLRAELEKLGATEAEVEAVVDGAWQAATEVDCAHCYARDELDLLRAPARQPRRGD